MKKIISVFLLLAILILALSACATRKFHIENYTWNMHSVLHVENDQFIMDATREENTAHPEAKIVDMTLIATDGKITITDITNDKTYEGTYIVDGKTPDGINYRVTIDGKSGHAIVAMTTFADGSEEPTLPINLGKYSLYFYSK